MKKLLGILFLTFILTSCGDEYSGSDYDKGYDDGYDGVSPKKNSVAYLDGYEEGDYDADCDYYKYNKLWNKYRAIKCHENE